MNKPMLFSVRDFRTNTVAALLSFMIALCAGAGVGCSDESIKHGADASMIDAFADAACIPSQEVCQLGQCGVFSVGCGIELGCGGCTAPEECGVGGVPNMCGCTGESDNDLCDAAGLFECGGSLLLQDRCGVDRIVDCGSCPNNEPCGSWAGGYCDAIACSSVGWCRAVGNPVTAFGSIQSLWADSSGGVWAAGSEDGGLGTSNLYYHDGTSWSFEASTPRFARAIGGAGGNLWIAADSGYIMKYEIASKTFSVAYQSLVSPHWFLDISVISPNDIWVVGSSGNLPRWKRSRFDGNSWSHEIGLTSAELNQRWYGLSFVGSDDIWVVGADGNNGEILDPVGPKMAHFDGVTWTQIASLPTDEYLKDVYAESGTAVWAVGNNGAIIHFDGITWSEETSGVTSDLKSVHGAGGAVWAVGDNGVILKRTTNGWQPQPSGTSHHLQKVLAISANEAWAGGDNGTLLHLY